MPDFKFNPKSRRVIKNLKEQAATWCDDTENTFVVVDDCGPQIIAAFSFRHHAEECLPYFGQACYMIGFDGREVQP